MVLAKDIIGIGTSAGGFTALRQLLPLFPANFPAAIAIVLHRHPTAASQLVELLDKDSRNPVHEPGNGDPFVPGAFYVAPRDHHMTVRDDRVFLDRGPKQNHTRPAIDPLFRSLAAYGPRVIGVLLTGMLSDGVGGLIAIKSAGGLTMVQDLAEALYPCMPRNAIQGDSVDYVLPLGEMAKLLETLSQGLPAS